MNPKKQKKDDDLKKKLEKAREEAAEKDRMESGYDEENDKIKEELEKMTELAKRTMADLQNLKRRQEEERASIYKMANAELIKSLLPILDNLNRAIAHMPENPDEKTKKWLNGIEMCIGQFEKVFTDFGLSEINSLNTPFDPDIHEAVMQGPGKKDHVTEEFEKGYKIGDRVLRHAKVKVGNGEKE